MTIFHRVCTYLSLAFATVIMIPDACTQTAEGISPSLAQAIAAEVQIDINELDLDTLAAIDVLALNNLSGIDYTGIELLSNLTELELKSNSLSDLSPFSELTQLKKLDLHDNRISDLSPLSKLVALTNLDISHNLVEKLHPLGTLTGLTQLRAHDNAIRNLAPLTSMTNLVALDLGSNRIENVSPLAKLTKLKQLTLNRNSITEIAAAGKMERLVYLDISDNKVKQLRPLANLKALFLLNASNNPLQSLQPLSTIASLEILRLQTSTFGGDLSPLKSLTKLTRLDAPHSDIRSIDSLANLNALRRLDLSHNRIVDIAPLAPIAKTLAQVNLVGNPLGIESRGTHLRTLREKAHFKGDRLDSPRALSNNFGKVDADKNDALSYSEAKQAYPSLTVLEFDALDTNKNWEITLAEIFDLVRALPDSLDVAWLGPNRPGKGLGSRQNPFRSFAEAQLALKPKGKLMLLPGAQLDTKALKQSLQIVSPKPAPKKKAAPKTP